MKIKRSIHAKLILLVVLSVLVSALCIGGICLFRMQKLVQHDLEVDMDIFCRDEAANLDYLMGQIEQSVNIIAGSFKDKITSIDYVTDDRLRDECTEEIKRGIQTITEHTDGCIASYMRFNPELSTPTAGVFMQRASKRNILDLVPTDISAYDSTDVEHVGWYYIPLSEGCATWMEPYKNENIDIYMISYVIPMYQDGELLGVVGMDIDFSHITESLSKSSIYDEGKIFLLNDSEDYAYSLNGEGFEHYTREQGWQNSSVFTLRNGMKLVYSVPNRVLNADSITLIRSLVITLVLLLIVCIALAIIVTSNIVRPLRKLTQEARKITQGDLDVNFDLKSTDEVGVLASALSETANSLKKHISIIDKMANHDAMTGVKNKRALEAYRQTLETEIAENRDIEFAILLFDFNGLKTANDLYGHKFGDDLIKMGSRLICNAFAHSPVFRFGGDEFIVVARNEDYRNREMLLEQFNRSIAENNDESMHNCLSIAYGAAVYDKETDVGGDPVFARADEQMYQNKEKMKAAAGNV